MENFCKVCFEEVLVGCGVEGGGLGFGFFVDLVLGVVYMWVKEGSKIWNLMVFVIVSMV